MPASIFIQIYPLPFRAFNSIFMKILIVEDEEELADSINHYLEKGGYLCETASTFSDAGEKTAVYEYDLVILDLMLPDGDGLKLLKHLKENRYAAGILIVSARNSLDDKINGLNLGADDYITKPFHLAELNARIHSILRRRQFDGNDRVDIGEINIDLNRCEVHIQDSPVLLTKTEYDLLLYFIHNKNRVLTKEQIAEHLWGEQADMLDSFDFIYTHVKNLRKKIVNAGGQDRLKNIYAMGYKFVLP